MSDEKTKADPLLEFWHGQGTAVIHLSKLKPLLAQHGFHIVTQAEKRVLDAMADVEDIAIDMTLDLRDDLSVHETRAWEAEQARRRTP